MTGSPGKWPWKNHSVAVTPLSPTIRFASASYSTIRSTSRNGQRCGISASISRVLWTVPAGASVSGWVVVSVTGSSGAMGTRLGCRSEPGSALGMFHTLHATARPAPLARAASRATGGGQERRRPDAVQQVRRHLALEERLVAEQRLVDRDVGGDPLDQQLVKRHLAARDRDLPIRAPD